MYFFYKKKKNQPLVEVTQNVPRCKLVIVRKKYTFSVFPKASSFQTFFSLSFFLKLNRWKKKSCLKILLKMIFVFHGKNNIMGLDQHGGEEIVKMSIIWVNYHFMS